jgi:hypothetical protein
MGARYGRRFVSGDQPGVTYSKARCADYFEYEPGARTCEQAATWHHYGEVVQYRTAAGILGLFGLAGYLFYRRRRTMPPSPPAFSPIVAAAAFTLAAALLLTPGLYRLASDQRTGAGVFLSAGMVSAVAAIISVVALLLRRLPRRDTSRSVEELGGILSDEVAKRR